MLLVGATQRFIRRPFIIAGLIQGFIGSLLSVGLMSITIYFSTKQIPELANLQDTKMFIILYGFIVALGLLISLVSTFFAVSKYLKMKTDFLYYH
jgi:cell division transport system permease protein